MLASLQHQAGHHRLTFAIGDPPQLPLNLWQHRIRPAYVYRYTAKYTSKLFQGLAYANAVPTEGEFPNRVFMAAGALFDHRNGFPDLSFRFEETQEEYGVRQITDVDR